MGFKTEVKGKDHILRKMMITEGVREVIRSDSHFES